MYLALMAQSFSSGTVDKLLSLDPLTLAMLVILATVVGFVASIYYAGRSNAAADEQQNAVVKFLTDEKSPMVVSNKRIADAIELGNKRAEEYTAAQLALGEKTDEQIKSINRQTLVIEAQSRDLRAYQTLVSDNLSAHTTQIEANTRVVADLKKNIDALTQQITDMLNKRDDCADVAGKVDELKKTVDKLVNAESARTNAVTATVHIDTPPADDALPKAS